MALPAYAATPAQEAELQKLEAALQPLALGMSGRTTLEEVRAAIAPGTSSIEKACEDGLCLEGLKVTGGDTVTYTGLFDRQYNAPAEGAEPGEPVADDWRLWLWIDLYSAPGLCLSVERWNEVMTAAGWPPLKPLVMIYSIVVSDNPRVLKENDYKAGRRLDVHTIRYASIRDGRQIRLATGPDVLMGQVNSSKDLKAARAMDDCVRAIQVDRD